MYGAPAELLNIAGWGSRVRRCVFEGAEENVRGVEKG